MLGTRACRIGCFVLQRGEGSGSVTFKAESSTSSAIGGCIIKLYKVLILFNGPSLRFGFSLLCSLSQVTTVTWGADEVVGDSEWVDVSIARPFPPGSSRFTHPCFLLVMGKYGLEIKRVWLVSVLQWYRKPDYNFFESYKLYRSAHPEQPFYILNPKMQWQLWDILQENSLEHIQPNPPSSGMLGKPSKLLVQFAGRNSPGCLFSKTATDLWCLSELLLQCLSYTKI